MCGSSDLELWDRSRNNSLSRCRNCGLVFTNPRIAKAEDKDRLLYTDSYFNQKSRMTEKLVAARKNSYRREIATLSRLTAPGRILDVGCGMGLFLECLDPIWEKHGCDVSSYGLEEAAARGIKTYHGEFERLDFPAAPFDVIYFRASLHHAYSPQACLKKAGQLLRPDGLVVVAMSNNCGGVCGRLFRGRIRCYEQAHNYLFSADTLKQYMIRTGFRAAEIDYPYFGTGYESWRDWAGLPAAYLKYRLLKLTGRLYKPEYLNFASPPFYGNYVSVYARKAAR